MGHGWRDGRPGLDLRTRELLLIASCTTLGFATPQLRAHIEAALNIGATREQIVDHPANDVLRGWGGNQ